MSEREREDWRDILLTGFNPALMSPHVDHNVTH